jgi:hypothetical protein
MYNRGGETPQKMPREQGDVIASFHEGRQVDWDHVEAVKEVFTEATLFNLLKEILVGGCQDPHIHGQGLFAPYAFEPLGLEYPKQLDLARRGYLAYLIQEYRTPMGLLESACLLANSPCKGPFFMAKKLTFQKCCRIGRAINDNKGFALSWTQLMNGPCHELFSSTAFSLNQDGGIRWRNILYQLVDHLHLRVFANDAAKLCRGFYSALEVTKTPAALLSINPTVSTSSRLHLHPPGQPITIPPKS